MVSIGWNFSAGGGAAISDSGALAAEAITTAEATVAAGSNKDFLLQIGDVSRVLLLAVKCNRYDGSVRIKGGDGADPDLVLSGPIFAFGPVAERLAASLETVTITVAAAPAEDAVVSFFIATSLT